MKENTEHSLENFYIEPLNKVLGTQQAYHVFCDLVPGKMIISTPHMHDYIELIYCLEGIFEITVNGTRLLLQPEELVIINSCEIHETASPGKCKYICIKFIPELLYTSTFTTFDFKYVIPFISSTVKHQLLFSKEELADSLVPAMILECLQECQEKTYGYEMALRTNITKIFLWFIRYWNQNSWQLDPERSLNADTLQKLLPALDFIANNYQRNLTLAEVAKHCNFSPSYFCKLFKQYTRKNYSEYLIYIRISNAEKLLLSTDLPITEIGESCGFATSSYFIKHFKKQKGISPNQFRKRLKN